MPSPETRKPTPQEDSYAAALERGAVVQREVIAGVRAELGDDGGRFTDAAIWQACVRLGNVPPAVVAAHLRAAGVAALDEGGAG